MGEGEERGYFFLIYQWQWWVNLANFTGNFITRMMRNVELSGGHHKGEDRILSDSLMELLVFFTVRLP
jgi:hypothetical protein